MWPHPAIHQRTPNLANIGLYVAILARAPGACGEDCAHGVGEVPALGVRVRVVLDDLRAVAQEAPAQEHVREVQVHHVHQEVEHLAQEKLKRE